MRLIDADALEFPTMYSVRDQMEMTKMIEDAPTVATCEDTISRQAAIDIERNATVDTNPSHFEAHQKFTQFMDDAEISSFGRWQWSNGFNTALTAVGIDLKKLPPAQPEPHEGHWIKHKTPDGGEQYECSECGVIWEFNDGTPEDNEAYFCPKCGAKMKGEANE